jgi:2-keto-4-pentenoate hydratase/2-oxohepta-3-ene-1,7-dioic acid hydratase in catechol pathway
VGPCIVRGLDHGVPEGLSVEGWVNGTRRQASSTRQLIFPIPQLVAFISSIMTLLPGDIISTGTPSGIGPLTAGDSVTVRVEGVGDLTNPVR